MTRCISLRLDADLYPEKIRSRSRLRKRIYTQSLAHLTPQCFFFKMLIFHYNLLKGWKSSEGERYFWLNIKVKYKGNSNILSIAPVGRTHQEGLVRKEGPAASTFPWSPLPPPPPLSHKLSADLDTPDRWNSEGGCGWYGWECWWFFFSNPILFSSGTYRLHTHLSFSALVWFVYFFKYWFVWFAKNPVYHYNLPVIVWHIYKKR